MLDIGNVGESCYKKIKNKRGKVDKTSDLLPAAEKAARDLRGVGVADGRRFQSFCKTDSLQDTAIIYALRLMNACGIDKKKEKRKRTDTQHELHITQNIKPNSDLSTYAIEQLIISARSYFVYCSFESEIRKFF